MRAGSAARAAALTAVVLGWNPCTVIAQQSRVSPFLPAGHWAVEVARTLDGQGLMPRGYDATMLRQATGEIIAGLDGAADESGLAADALARLRTELGQDWMGAGLRSSGGVAVGVASREGRLHPGLTYLGYENWRWPAPREDLEGVAGALTHMGRRGRLAWGLEGRVDEGGGTLRDAYAMASLGAVGVWVGVVADGYYGVPTGSVVLTSTVPGPGVGFSLLEPAELPGLLRHVGPVRFATQIYRGRSNGAFEHPYMWLMRGSVAPHARLSLGVSRAIMLGGEGNGEFSARTIAYALIGKHSDGFDNHIVAVTARYRLPTETFLPLVARLEWGFDDSAGAWRDVPGIIAVLESPALPFAPRTSAGVALTHFAPACCGNPIWYRNWSFQEGWSDGGEPLGHSLGGHGREWLGYGRAVLAGARLQVEAAAFGRWRGEGNIFAPLHEGHSAGGRLGLVLLSQSGWRWFAEAELDRATDGSWREHRLEAGVRALF